MHNRILALAAVAAVLSACGSPEKLALPTSSQVSADKTGSPIDPELDIAYMTQTDQTQSDLYLMRANGSGRRLVLTVVDEGPGLSEADLPRLFDPYFSRKDGGVGLGLAMVKRIVEEHGGRVTASNRSDGGSGAVFRISLPVAA